MPPATVPIATLGESGSRQSELANLGRGIGRRGTVRQPPPSAGPIGGDEERAAGRTGGFAQFAKKPLQPGKFVALGARVRVPHDEPKVVPPQWIADRRGGRIDVDGLGCGKDLPHPQGAKAVLVLQPAFTFVFVGDDDLLGDPVDVFEQCGGNRFDDRVPHLFGDIERAHFGEDQLIHQPLTEPIGANERVDGHPVLGQSPGVLQRRGRRLDPLHGDVVAQRTQNGVHISLDAGPEQFH